MEYVNLNLGGEDFSIEYYTPEDISDKSIIIYSIQDFNGRELYEKIDDETFEEIQERIKIIHYGLK